MEFDDSNADSVQHRDAPKAVARARAAIQESGGRFGSTRCARRTIVADSLTFENAKKSLRLVDIDLEDHEDEHQQAHREQDVENQVAASSKMPTAEDTAAQEEPNNNETAEASTARRNPRSTWFSNIFDGESAVFSVRVAVAVTVASMFNLAFPVDDGWDQSTWIYVTAAIVIWQPRIDTATVMKKSIERTIGTMIGAFLGMAVGMLSLLVLKGSSVHDQSIFLACAVAVHGFIYPYICDRAGLRANYAAWLGNFTFGLVLLVFHDADPTQQPWTRGFYRVLNIFFGCVIATGTSLLLWPISTKIHLTKKISSHMMSSGCSVDLILSNAIQVLTQTKELPNIVHLATGLACSTEDSNASYIRNIESWKEVKSYFLVLKYDPWFLTMPKEEQERFRNHMTVRLCRSFRINMNVIILDSMLRQGMEFKGPRDGLCVLNGIGARAKVILDQSLPRGERDSATKALLENDLVRLRRLLARQSELVVAASTIDINQVQSMFESDSQVGLPLALFNQRGEQVLLFFQLVEQLILRIARLHFYCTEYEPDNRYCPCGPL